MDADDTPQTGAAQTAARENGRPPRDELVRALRGGLELQRAEDDSPADAGAMPTLFGHFTPFNRWTEIDSFWEGHFLERIAPGAFKKTFREQQPKVLFQHGMDPQIGDKVLGPPDVLREEAEGPYYEVPLLDTTYNRDLVPGLEAGLYGASFRFTIMREEWVEEPGVSEHNPAGLPERTIKEVRCSEFGPVTFPAYADATAGVRSLTDEFIISRATREPERLRALLEFLERRDEPRPPATRDAHPDSCDGCDHPDCSGPTPASTTAPPTARAEAEPHPGEGRRTSPHNDGLYGLPPKEQSWRL